MIHLKCILVGICMLLRFSCNSKESDTFLKSCSSVNCEVNELFTLISQKEDFRWKNVTAEV
jgi:hypothetical protein